MKLSDGPNRLISLGLSIAVHLAILAIHFPDAAPKVKVTPAEYKIPVSLKVTEPAPPAPVKKKSKTLGERGQQKRAPNPKANQRADTTKTPTSLPGDRKLPVVKRSVTPTYPKSALNNEWSGKITVEFSIDKTGKVKDYKILKSTGHEILDQAFIRTVSSGYSFKPKRIMGKNKNGKIRLSYAFTL